MTKTYQWKRFWCPRTGTTILGDNGFLSDPTSEYGSFTNPDLRSLEQILPHRFLGLLGEPGIGKSKVVELEREKIDALINNAGDKSLWLNLNSIGTEDRLVKELFDSPEFQSLNTGAHNLHIFLDSLDEALMRIDVLTSLLLEKIKKQFHNRLFLRVSCRTAIWPQSLEDQAKLIWSKESVGVYELASLTKADFKNAATANEIDPEQFLKEVVEKDAVAFAIKPVTLNFLIDIFKTSQSLPSSQIDLYEAGCLHLCEEHNPSHKETRIQSTLTARQKMDVASRIAAATVFSNKTTIWKGSASQTPEESISSDLFLENFIFNDGQSISLTAKLIDEVLDTGLFSSRGPHSFGWSHKTYAEFLAARHMSQLPLNQITSLLFSPDDEENKIIPQLQETAGWLSSMVPALFKNIVATDPEVLLRSDVSADDIHKQAIVASLIEMHRNKRVITSFELKQRVHKLKHPNLSQQIKVILLDKNEDEDLRAFIINLIEACAVEHLFGELPPIALNKQEPLHIRSVASRALVEIGSESDKIKLKPLLSVSPEDPLDDLRGTALRILWPKQLNAKELFDILTPAPNDHYVGSYDFFMGHQIIPNILPQDWQFALDWAAQQANINLSYSSEKFIEDIFISAWDHIDQENNLNAYAKAIKNRAKKSLDFLRRDRASEFSLKVKREHTKRRSLLEKLIPLFINEESSLFWLLYSGMLIAEDVEWMTEKVLSSSDTAIKSVWCKTIEYASSWENPDCSQVVYRASEKDLFMAQRFEWFRSPIVLDSPQALKLRADHQSMRESQNRRKPKVMETKTFTERILSSLSVIESTNPIAWQHLVQDLAIDLKSSTYRDHFKSDVTKLANWNLLSDPIKDRIIRAAKLFLDTNAPLPPNTDGSFYHHDLAGGKAFYLLAKENPALFNSITTATWSKWAGFIFRQPNWDHGGDNAVIRNTLLLKAYQNNPTEITNFLIKLIIAENDKDGNIFVQEKIEIAWNSTLEKALVEMLSRNKLKPQAHGEILKILLERKNTTATEKATAFIRKKPSKNDQDKYFIIAQILLSQNSSAHWKTIWKRITDTPSFGKLLLEKISYESGNGSKLLSQLPENDLAALYIWLVNQYPYEEDGKRAGGVVSPRDSIAMWRDNVLNTIVNRGTNAACEQMKIIVKRLPKHDWLQRSLLHALLNKRRNSWLPPKPEWILALSNDKNKRWIQSGDDLLNVIIDCLKEAELLLQGETPQSRYLWNIKPNITPKEENDFSDWVKNHLDQYLAKKGVVLAREVEIRKGHGNHSGQITDIHVTALLPKNTAKDEFEPIKAIIEVKGCWNDGLYKDMEIQLKNRYLKDNLCKHGLYLVGWFNCAGWNAADQKKRAPKKNLPDVKDFLEAQAKQLSDSTATVRSLIINTGFK